MSLKHAILVLLDREPGSGYDLAQRFNRGIGQFWQASHQQIYQQLKKLDDGGLVKFVLKKQQAKPDRKVYSITPSGRKALAAWLSDKNNPPMVRDALLIKIFAAGHGEIAVLLAEVDRHIGLHQEQLNAHRKEEVKYFAADSAQRLKQRWPYLTLRRGIRYEQEWIAWLSEVHECLLHDSQPMQPVPD